VPGFSEACQSGMHNACAERAGECRCQCHPITQALVKAGPVKSGGKGGVRRKLKQNITAAVAAVPQLPEIIEEDSLELKNTCPKCKAVAKATDKFCRKDGTRLCLGKPCERCAAPCEEQDSHCWACGWKLGEAVPAAELSPLPRAGLSLDKTPSLPPGVEELIHPGSVEVVTDMPAAGEDPLSRLQRMARESGMLKETTVA